jgi:acetyltransferase
MKELTREMLASFTQIDYDREIALVAIDEEAESERILGVARIIGDADGREGEFAVLVSDAWQGKGIGSALLKKCLVIAQERGLERVHGLVLQENKNMLALAEKAGFSIDRGGEAGEYRLRIAFDRSARG